MSVYQIQIPPSIYHQLELEIAAFSSKQKAIDVLTKAFKDKNFDVKIHEEAGKVSFLNKFNASLADIVQVRN